ncbi:MAG: hypothetical protein HQL47_07160 [Gammaproteobacteria bacterium]|nr:hypothetical protein [Gammaproteobacteria bacterium]
MSYLSRLIGLLLLLPASLALAAPAALVEDIEAAGAKLQMLDFVSPGDVVELGADGRLSLGYLNSCVQEQITGGKVTVGDEQSQVEGGEVSRSKTQCDGGSLALAANQAVHSGAVAMRDIDTEAAAKLTVHDLSPLFILPKGGKVVIKRVDQTGERHRFQIEEKSAGATRLDLAAEKVQLAAGGKYMITAGGVAMIFQVAKDAESGKVGTLGRLVPF